MTNDHVYNVLFLCTGNSARSILAEALMDHWGQGRFKGYSAGSFPKGEPHPLAIKLLSQFGMPTEQMRSKSWNEFAAPGAPQMDFVFTVCDQAAGEMCPVWPGHPITAHWGVPDPAAVEGREAMRMLAFRECFARLERRIKLFVDIRLEMDRKYVEGKVRDIGRICEASDLGQAS
jgi:arsenate reductase